ncbi:hypothetical protein C8Q76DRAFT_204683 [Earliella scabrosa]|nr:hypothetical protein C8Q76DRAFT_204683 [Earliella scabrosa]
MQSTSHTPDPDSTVVGQVCYIHESLATPILRIFLETAATEENETIKLKCQEELDRLCTNPAIGKLRPCFTLSTNLKGTKTICVRGTIGQTDPNNLCGIIKHFYVGIFPNLGFYGTPHLHITPEERNPRSAVIAFEMTCDKDLFPTKKPSGPESSYSTIPPPSTPRKNRISQLEKQSLAILRELCQAKYSAWQVKCKKEPGYAEDCLKEFLVTLSQMTLFGYSLTTIASGGAQSLPLRISLWSVD